MAFPRLLSISEWQGVRYQLDDQRTGAAIAIALTKVYLASTIYQRIDGLIDLYQLTRNINLELCIQLNNSVLQIVMHIFDDNNPQSVEQKMLTRQQLREFDPDYIPWQRPYLSDELSNDLRAHFEALVQEHAGKPDRSALIQKGIKQFNDKINASKCLLNHVDVWQQVEDHKANIKYFSAAEIENYRVIPYQGKLIKWVVGSKYIQAQHLSFEFFDSSHLCIEYVNLQNVSVSLKNRGAYVIDVNGGIFVGPSLAPECVKSLFSKVFLERKAIIHVSYIYHMTMRPFMAGQIADVHHGKIGEIDAGSGHLKPTYLHWLNAKRFFHQHKLLLNTTKIQVFHPESKDYIEGSLTQNVFEIYKFAMLNHLRQDLVTDDYLSKHNKSLRNRYLLQESINQQATIWRNESKLWFDQPSGVTLKLNIAIEEYTNYACINDVDLTLSILQKALEAINNWQDYHKEHQLYSRRFESIISLQTRLFDHVIHFKLYKLLRLLDSDDKLIGDYLDYKITKEELFASAKATKHSPLFFAANLISEPEVKSILISLCNIESMNQRELISHLDHFIEEQQQDTFIKAIHQN